MINAPALQQGDTIAFYSPSSPATSYAPKRTQRAIQFLQSKGFNVISGQLTGNDDFYRSGTIEERANELNQLIHNPDIRCIISTIGGANSNSLLPYIDYDAIKRDPKIFIGYSDVTAILLGIFAQTGLTTFYGPALTASFGELSPLVDETFNSFRDVLMQRALPFQYDQPKHWSDEYISWEDQDRPKALTNNEVDFRGQGTLKGRLIGGNLNTMTGIWGSPYMPDIQQGDILLIEDSLKDIATVERLFAFLQINHVFEKISALIVGKHELLNDLDTGRNTLDVLLEVLQGKPLPIVYNFDCSHTHPMLTMPIGAQVELNFDNQQVSILSDY